MKTAAKDFKMSELGFIPKDWEVKRVEEFAEVTTGNRNTQDAQSNGAYPFYVRSPIVERIDDYSFDTTGVVTAGDGVGTGKIFHFAQGKFGLHQRAYLIYDFDGVDAKYFYWVFSRNFYDRIMQMTAKSSVDSVRREMITGMEIALPPLLEQRKIAAALSDVDEMIAALEKLIEKKRKIKTGAMQRLLTGKTRLPGFKGAWVEKRLGELGSWGKGAGISRSEAQTGRLPAVRYGEIYTTHNDYIKKFESFISDEVARQSTRMKKGDIVFAGSGETKEEIGKCAAFLGDEEAYAGGDLIILSPESQYDSKFLGFVLNSTAVVTQKSVAGQGDAVVHIRTESLAAVVVRIPPTLAEQKAIAKVLGDMDEEIAALEAELAKARQLKQGMMLELLTGKVRLV